MSTHQSQKPILATGCRAGPMRYLSQEITSTTAYPPNSLLPRGGYPSGVLREHTTLQPRELGEGASNTGVIWHLFFSNSEFIGGAEEVN